MRYVFIIVWVLGVSWLMYALKPVPEQPKERTKLTKEEQREVVKQWSLTLFPLSMFYWREQE